MLSHCGSLNLAPLAGKALVLAIASLEFSSSSGRDFRNLSPHEIVHANTDARKPQGVPLLPIM